MAEYEEMTEDEIEAGEEEVSRKKTMDALDALAKRYKGLVGSLPPSDLPIAEIQNKIVQEMEKRNLRPYKL